MCPRNRRLLIVIVLVIIIAAVGYGYFYLSYIVPNPTLSTLFRHKYNPSEKTILIGTIIHNPIRDAYQRGIESYCWDNIRASHLLQLDVKLEIKIDRQPILKRPGLF